MKIFLEQGVELWRLRGVVKLERRIKICLTGSSDAPRPRALPASHLRSDDRRVYNLPKQRGKTSPPRTQAADHKVRPQRSRITLGFCRLGVKPGVKPKRQLNASVVGRAGVHAFQPRKLLLAPVCLSKPSVDAEPVRVRPSSRVQFLIPLRFYFIVSKPSIAGGVAQDCVLLPRRAETRRDGGESTLPTRPDTTNPDTTNLSTCHQRPNRLLPASVARCSASMDRGCSKPFSKPFFLRGTPPRVPAPEALPVSSLFSGICPGLFD